MPSYQGVLMSVPRGSCRGAYDHGSWGSQGKPASPFFLMLPPELPGDSPLPTTMSLRRILVLSFSAAGNPTTDS